VRQPTKSAEDCLPLSPVCRPDQASTSLSHLIVVEHHAIRTGRRAQHYRLPDPRNTGREPVTLSTNVAGITRTRSMAHPIFQAAFADAPSFGVRIFDPETTRALSGPTLARPSQPHGSGCCGAAARRRATEGFGAPLAAGTRGALQSRLRARTRDPRRSFDRNGTRPRACSCGVARRLRKPPRHGDAD
jgi:hypothetical protein